MAGEPMEDEGIECVLIFWWGCRSTLLCIPLMLSKYGFVLFPVFADERGAGEEAVEGASCARPDCLQIFGSSASCYVVMRGVLH